MRTVTLVLVDPAGQVLGSLPPFEVAVPWWQEVGEIAARTGAQVLRLLSGDRPAPPGGHVTYLAEVPSAPGRLEPAEIDRTPQPRRVAYAEVGGPAATLAWAAGHLGPVVARQQRTWNLSAIWRVEKDGTPVAWIKQVPAFFAHEPDAIRLVGATSPGLVPSLIADHDGRMLLGHIPGEDGYGAGADVCARIAAAFHPVQEHFAGRAGELAAAGIPDRRRLDFTFAQSHVEHIPGLAELLDDLPRRLAEIDGCGLPATLVHGDLHPGNVRLGPGGRLTLMDWGDCYLGHPALDALRLTAHLTDPEAVFGPWAYRWEQSRPGSEPRRAAELMRPIAALWAAETYAGFLAGIEPAEHPYHAADVPEQLEAAVAAAQR
jgi:hypothetical protein